MIGGKDVRRGLHATLSALLLMAAVVAMRPNPADAQSVLSGGIIEEIRVEGTQRIDPTTVLSYLRVSPGDSFDPVRINESLKDLFGSGLFADVTLRREGDALVVVVTENPIINRVAFEGNRRIDDAILDSETELRQRKVFTRTKVQSDVQRILEVYRRQGRFAATVDAKVIQLEQNRVDLVFEINEGPESEIRSINFIGNRAFSDGSLREEIATSEAAFWKFLSTTDTYDPDRLTFDRELLRRFYLERGYADFRVLSVVAELTTDREGFIVTFTIDEGERYTFGAIDITTTLKNLDPEILRKQVTTVEGEWYDASAVDQTVTGLTEAAGNLGFAFVDVRPRVERDRESRIIQFVYEIREGPKVYVERIDIEGNIRTIDQVIRREFRLVEGDAFNATLLARSRRRVQRLGFFQSVNVDSEPGSEVDRTVITVNVEEQATGDLSFAAGFSSDVGPLGTVAVRERNLLGRGQDLRVGFTLSGDASQIDLSFTEPYFLDRNLAAGVDVFRTVSEKSESSFDEERIGASLRAGYDLGPDLRQVWRYTLQRQEVSNVDVTASAIVKDDEGSNIESSIGQTLSYDKRDARFDPREGYVVQLSNTLAGLGGDVSFIKLSLGGSYHYPVPFFDNVTATTVAKVGNITGLADDTRVSDRFFIGGGSLRGFEPAGIGPRDSLTGDALGGKHYYTGTLEFSFPLGLPEELAVRGRVFSDVGALWSIDGDDSGVDDSSSPRVSVGTGISWNSPFGPVVIDFGFAVVEEDFDKTELVNFSFGTRF